MISSICYYRTNETKIGSVDFLYPSPCCNQVEGKTLKISRAFFIGLTANPDAGKDGSY